MCIVSHISINEAYNKVCFSDTFFVRGDRALDGMRQKRNFFQGRATVENKSSPTALMMKALHRWLLPEMLRWHVENVSKILAFFYVSLIDMRLTYTTQYTHTRAQLYSQRINISIFSLFYLPLPQNTFRLAAICGE